MTTYRAQRNAGFGLLRKDRNLQPSNTDFDLYGLVQDGDSKGSLNAKFSRGDILLADEGPFIGAAKAH
jgi:general secretion pathway protein G